MSRRRFPLAFGLTFALALVVVATISTPVAARESGLVGAHPNPVADGDAGEFVVVRVPVDSQANWTLTDGETTVQIPASRPAALVALSESPSHASDFLDDVPVLTVSSLALSNAGERLYLRRNGVVVDFLSYTDAPDGERLVRDGDDEVWRPVGLARRDVHEFGPANATVFVLPDAPAQSTETVQSADERLLLAGYTFSSSRVASALADAAERGVHVRVLVEGGPVGGISARQADTLDRLVAAGVNVDVIDGPRARFRFHHPKYAVVDDSVLVATENWKPAGLGGRSSRGWGVVVHSPAVATDLAALFRHDADWRDTIEWQQFRAGRTFASETPATDSYPARFAPRTVPVESVDVLTAPGNAERALVGRIDRAQSRVDVVQPTVGSRSNPLLRATFRAAARGVRVRVLLSGAWYVADENRALVEWINDRATRRDLPIEARVATPNGRFEKIHAKGVLADDTAVVGSLNWNDVSASENREVLLVLHGSRAAAYYSRVFDADWTGGAREVPRGVALAAGIALVAAVAVARRRIRFD